MNRIKEFREKARMTRADLGGAVGVHPSAIGHYEDERRVPSLERSREIVVALNEAGANCSLDDVFPPEQGAA